jgi:hypothetical protein
MSSYISSLLLTGQGPTGLALPLGIETVFPTTYVALYMWLSLIILFLIAASASQRNQSFFGILLPAMAAFEVWVGWLQFPNEATGWGIVVLVSIFAVALYMKDRLHANFGIPGPGSMTMNLLMFIIILQCVVGFTNGLGIFTSNAAESPTEYQNVDLSTAIPNVNNSGGFLNQLWSTLTLMTEVTVATIRLLISIATALVAFSVVLAGIFPFIPQSSFGLAALGVLQVAIYYMYVLWFVNFIRPTYSSLDV